MKAARSSVRRHGHRNAKKRTNAVSAGYFRNIEDKETLPLGGYGVLMAGYLAMFAGLFAASRAQENGKKPAEGIELKDLFVLGAATHKVSRLITKDWVTSPLRSPFTEYKESSGSGEVYEKSRGKGLRRAVGDLLTCPWCAGAWVAAAAGFGFTLAPRATKQIAGIFAIEAAADFLHAGYDALKGLKK